MKIGIIKEGKIPHDARAALTPKQCSFIQKQYPDVRIVVEPSPFRCFSDDDYLTEGVEVSTNMRLAIFFWASKKSPFRG